MSTAATDPVAAAVHWRAADRHRDAAVRLEQNHCPEGARAALAAAEREERMAMLLEGRAWRG